MLIVTSALANAAKTADRANLPLKTVDPIQSSLLALVQVHALEDLRGLNGEKGCDIWRPLSPYCRWAGFIYCATHGYAGGAGPVEWTHSMATISCIPSKAGAYLEVPYSGECHSTAPGSFACAALSRTGCKAKGFKTSNGVIGANSNVIATICLKGENVFDSIQFSSIEELNAADPNDKGCTRDTLIQGEGCQHVVHRYCQMKGYGTGYGVLEFNDSLNNGSVSCAKTQFIENGMARSTVIDGYERPAKIGSMVMGGASFAGDLTYQDAIINQFPYPILVNSVAPVSSFVGNAQTPYSKDLCFYLGRPGTFQYDDNDDGEVACTYSEEKDTPSVNFGSQRGLLLRPGERLTFQGTPQWQSGGRGPSGEGLYAGSTVTISKAAPGTIGMRRVRFPRWDTAYNVPAANSPIHVYAGCDSAQCPAVPVMVPPGKPKISSNSWYLAPQPTSIRGVSFFTGASQTVGVQHFKGCIRVVKQGGANIREPWCFDIADKEFGPSTFNRIFGALQNGSSFVPLDIDVPAGALVGVDFTLLSESSGALDIAAYVWFSSN